MDYVEWTLVLAGLTVALYYYMMSNYNYWDSRGVKGPKPLFFFGNIKELMTRKMSMAEFFGEIYRQHKKEPFVGIYLRRSPLLVLNDLDLIKDVLIKDFSKFMNRGTTFDEKLEPLSAHLFNLDPVRWRPTRMRLSPVFTSGKLKEMFYLLNECADHLDEFLTNKISGSSDGIEMEVRELTAKFTTDVIGVCAFGLQMNAMATEDSPFRAMGRRIFAHTWRQFVLFQMRVMAPGLLKIFGSFLVDREMNDFFVDTTRQAMDYRKKNGVVKHDFVDLLMGIRDHPDKIAEIEMTDSFLAAQLFVFFIAGFETSSSTMSNALYELALNHEIQDKLRQEINEEMNRTGGIIEYEGIKNMKYLDMIFQETLRKYPPVALLMRQASEPHTFESASGEKLLTIEKDQKVWIPVYGIQMDPEYYPKPEIFDPERFTPEAKKSRHPMTDLSFGDGPRNCIGKRFGVIQTKVGLVKFLQRYKVEACKKTQIPYVIDPKGFLLAPKNGIWLKIVKLNDSSNDI